MDKTQTRIDGIVIGVLVGYADAVTPLVTYAGNPQVVAIAAKTVAALQPADVGRRVALAFEGGSPSSPIVLGCIQADMPMPTEQQPEMPTASATIDDEELVFVAKRRIKLVCGRARIILEADGTVQIRGVNLESRAAMQNRIKGSSVSIN